MTPPIPPRLRRMLRTPVAGRPFSAINRLDLLARAYGGSDKFEHGYLRHYAQHLGARRLRPMRVLEIGVGGYDGMAPGGSLKIWRDYFQRSTIVGMDLHDKTVELGPRVKFVRGDQSSPADLRRLIAGHGPFDIIIDDGSHVGDHQHISFDALWPTLTPGGWYVIEDLSTSYYPEFGGSADAGPRTGVGLVQRLVDALQAGDNTFQRYPEWGSHSGVGPAQVAELCLHPGIAFVHKAD